METCTMRSLSKFSCISLPLPSSLSLSLAVQMQLPLLHVRTAANGFQFFQYFILFFTFVNLFFVSQTLQFCAVWFFIIIFYFTYFTCLLSYVSFLLLFTPHTRHSTIEKIKINTHCRKLFKIGTGQRGARAGGTAQECKVYWLTDTA